MPNPHERTNMHAAGARNKRRKVMRAALARKLEEKRGQRPEMSKVGRAGKFKGEPSPRFGHSMRARKVSVPTSRVP